MRHSTLRAVREDGGSSGTKIRKVAFSPSVAPFRETWYRRIKGRGCARSSTNCIILGSGEHPCRRHVRLVSLGIFVDVPELVGGGGCE